MLRYSPKFRLNSRFGRLSVPKLRTYSSKNKEHTVYETEEYKRASEALKKQIKDLEKQIKGEHDIRENLDSMISFPQRTSKKVRIDSLPLLLEETIRTTGPLPLSTYMRQCLTHPEFGYYTTRNPLDLRTGDFITSPEISSVFGEMVAIYLVQVWQAQNMPKRINLVEFGPGRGTLMHDVLQCMNRFNLGMDIEISMIETSRVLRHEQHSLLCEALLESDSNGFNYSVTKWNNKIKWVENETDLIDDDMPHYILAHEFFDALPIKSFKKTEHGWRELMVDHSPTVEGHQKGQLEGGALEDATQFDTEFHLTISSKETPSSRIPSLSPRFNSVPVGTRIEICPDAELFIKKIARLIDNKSRLGAALIMDYGLSDAVPENSLRGIYKHKFVSPFFKPGEVDLSVDVDFENLRLLAAEYVDTVGPVEQGDFLHELGIGYRIDQLIKKNHDKADEQDKIYQAYLRLTDKDEKGMGKIYKFFGLLPKGSETPLGFRRL